MFYIPYRLPVKKCVFCVCARTRVSVHICQSAWRGLKKCLQSLVTETTMPTVAVGKMGLLIKEEITVKDHHTLRRLHSVTDISPDLEMLFQHGVNL